MESVSCLSGPDDSNEVPRPEVGVESVVSCVGGLENRSISADSEEEAIVGDTDIFVTTLPVAAAELCCAVMLDIADSLSCWGSVDSPIPRSICVELSPEPAGINIASATVVEPVGKLDTY